MLKPIISLILSLTLFTTAGAAQAVVTPEGEKGGIDIVIIYDLSSSADMDFISCERNYFASPCFASGHFYLAPKEFNEDDILRGVTFPRGKAVEHDENVDTLTVFDWENNCFVALDTSRHITLLKSFFVGRPGFEAWKYHFMLDEEGNYVRLSSFDESDYRYNHANRAMGCADRKETASALALRFAKEILLLSPSNKVAFCAYGEQGWSRYSLNFTSDFDLIESHMEQAQTMLGADISAGLSFSYEILNNRDDTQGRDAYVILISGGETYMQNAKMRAKRWADMLRGQHGESVLCVGVYTADKEFLKSLCGEGNYYAYDDVEGALAFLFGMINRINPFPPRLFCRKSARNSC